MRDKIRQTKETREVELGHKALVTVTAEVIILSITSLGFARYPTAAPTISPPMTLAIHALLLIAFPDMSIVGY
jgi:hypothetical protein